MESAQVHSAQVSMAPPPDISQQPNWVFSMVLPFSDAPPVELAFERHHNPDSGSDRLVVNVHSHSEDYGELWLKTELRDNKVVDLVMWATRTGVAELARGKAQALQEHLQSTGLMLASFKVVSGPRPVAEAQPLPEWVGSKPGLVVDVQA